VHFILTFFWSVLGHRTYGDYSYTRAGLALTLLGTALAALKTMLASQVVRPRTLPHAESAQSPNPVPIKRHAHTTYGRTRRVSMKRMADEGYLSGDEHIRPDFSITSAPALHPLDVLLRLSPLACIQCLIAAFLSGETTRWSATWIEPTPSRWRSLALNGALAFLLNYVSFVASRQAGALSMTVAGEFCVSKRTRWN
jgi:hypothetical protein